MPFFLSMPLLAYARWRGYSWHEETEGVRHGYWEFKNSTLLRALLPWTLLVDAALAAMFKIYWPLLMGKTVVCERFVLDMLVDMGVAFDEPALYQRLPGTLYLRLIPARGKVFILELDAAIIQARRPDLKTDRRLEARCNQFRQMIRDLSLISLSSALPVQEVLQQIGVCIK